MTEVFGVLKSSGTTYMQYLEFKKDAKNGDCAAEAEYHLEGASTNQYFTLQARQRPNEHLSVQFEGDLHTLGNYKGSLINLGFRHDSTVAFALAGKDDGRGYVSSDAPIGWMQATLPTIGNKTLQQISMPGTYNSGGSEWVGCWAKPCPKLVTQESPVYGQLTAGARFLDIRPSIRYEVFGTHYTSPDKSLGGAITRSLTDIIADINQFCKEFPGELIILDVNDDMNLGGNPFDDLEWRLFWDRMQRIEHLWSPKNEYEREADITTLPISTFIEDGKSAVVIRVKTMEAYLPDNLMTAAQASNSSSRSAPILSDRIKFAVIPESRFFYSGSISQERGLNATTIDQIDKMSRQPRAHITYMTLSPNKKDEDEGSRGKRSIVFFWEPKVTKAIFELLWPAIEKDDGKGLPNVLMVKYGFFSFALP
jgi:hypothetical protein